MEIKVTIPDNKLPEFYSGFLYIHPIPQDDDGKAEFSKSVWVKKWVKKSLVRSYKSGKRRKMHDELQVTYDVDE